MSSSRFQRAPRAIHVFAALSLLAALTGCGGGGGGPAAPVTAFTLSSDVLITGGTHSSGTIPLGTQTFTLTDHSSHTTTFTGVSVPVAITGTAVTVLRAHSVLVAGVYSASTATLIDPSGNRGLVVLSNGALANDIAFASGSQIVLPVLSIGALTFTGGITATVSGDTVNNNTGNNEFALNTAGSNLPTGSGTNILSGTYQNYSNPPVVSTGNLSIDFSNSAGSLLTVTSSTGNGASSPTFMGSISGGTVPYTSSTLTITATN